jgi:hypothetical protein
MLTFVVIHMNLQIVSKIYGIITKTKFVQFNISQ